jgi:diguanylate cyclase (GGDEF)-like protein
MSRTVLLVDDSIPLHALVRSHLEPHGFTLHSAYDGESALSMAASIHPNLILLDVNIPRMNGFEVCKTLKCNPATASVPVIFLTANSVVTSKVAGLELGAVDYITKPFQSEELAARVRLALRGTPSGAAATMLDPVTGLWNRDYLNAHMPAHLSMARRSGRPLACVVSEIDQFSTLVAKHGEAAADEVLRCTGQILRGKCRAEDIVCRLEGGVIAALFLDTNCASAAHIADRFREDVQRRLRECGGIEMNVTCSCGVADTLVTGGETLLDCASAAAHRASRSGRNRVSIARPAAEKRVAAA